VNPLDTDAATAAAGPLAPRTGEFVAVNYIRCSDAYRERFEQLFRSRAHAIDRLPGFHRMMVLKPQREDDCYLVVSFWTDRASFDHWHASAAFAEGHRRGFADVSAAKARGEAPPMTSRMEGYELLCD